MLAFAVSVLVVGFAVLAWSADRLVAAASAVALHLGMTPVVVGVFVVGFGTSAPELLVSALAALDEAPELALGNALGSNIANVGLILGITLLLTPVPRHGAEQRLTVLLLTLATLLTLGLIANGDLNRLEGLVLMAGLGVTLGLILHASRRGASPLPDEPVTAEQGPVRSAVELVISLAIVLGSARALVWAAVTLAEAAGVSELVIGLGVVAVGTSLPELATVLASARRREYGLLYGNLLGSNLFNLLAVLGIAAMIYPVTITPLVLYRDGLAMAAFTVPLLLLSLGRLAGVRPLGAALLFGYGAYQAGLLLSS